MAGDETVSLAYALLMLARGAPAPAPVLSCAEMDQAFPVSKREPVPVPRVATDLQVTTQESLCGGWAIIDVWQMRANGDSVWHARRKQMDRHGQLKVGTLDSAACPPFEEALRKLADLRLTVALGMRDRAVRRRPPPSPMPPRVDGTGFGLRVQSARQLDGSYSTITVEGGDGPLADWVIGSVYPLEACWR